MSSWKTFSKLRRRIRFAVRLCPLSALFGTPVCNLTFLNFCISYRFVFLEGRTAVACFSFVYRLHLVCFVKGNKLFPLTIPSAELSQLDRSSPAACSCFLPLRVDCLRRLTTCPRPIKSFRYLSQLLQVCQP